MMINKVLEKRQVDEDSDSDYVDLEEDFDPVINKGFCKSIYPLIVKLFVSKQIQFPFFFSCLLYTGFFFAEKST